MRCLSCGWHAREDVPGFHYVCKYCGGTVFVSDWAYERMQSGPAVSERRRNRRRVPKPALRVEESALVGTLISERDEARQCAIIAVRQLARGYECPRGKYPGRLRCERPNACYSCWSAEIRRRRGD